MGRIVGVGVVAREPDELVEMRRVLGAELTAFRKSVGWSQGRLAIAAKVDRTSVAHIESGRSRADERFWRIADEKCQAEGALLAGFRAWEAASQEHEVREREAQLAEARAMAERLRAKATPPCRCGGFPVGGLAVGGDGGLTPQALVDALVLDDAVGSLAGDGCGPGGEALIAGLAKLLYQWVGAMNRRELLQLLGWATGSAAVPMWGTLNPDEQERLVYAIAAPSRVDNQVIEHIEAMLRSCKRQEDLLGSRAVLNTALAQRQLVNELLKECPDELRPDLLSVYSDMSISVGFYFFDLDNVDRAEFYWDEARVAAQNANNADLAIYALCEMSHAACWHGETRKAIDSVAAARNLLGETDHPLLRVCVADKAAQAYALDNQYQACIAECENAQDALASADLASARSPAYWYHEGHLASERSGCLLQLGKPREAITSAGDGVALFDKNYVGSLAHCNLRLGNGYLASGEIRSSSGRWPCCWSHGENSCSPFGEGAADNTGPHAAVGKHSSSKGAR